jgi:GntR family transcriptional repressor for pyruvate dehydrogenase complex
VQAMGYIEIRRGTGTFIISKESQNSRMNAVRWFKKEEIKILEMLEFRRYIEPYLVRLAAKRITKDELENLDEIMNRYAAADCQGDAVGLIVLDSKFHSAIAKATHNHVFISVFDELMIFLNEYFTHSTAVRIAENKLHEIPYQTHKKVYAALCQHDEVKAESEMRAHIDRTIDKMTNAAQDKDCE